MKTEPAPESRPHKCEWRLRIHGTRPFGVWFDRLDPQAAAKVATATARLRAGNTTSVKRIGSIGEYRIDWGPGYRIYLGRDGEALIVLLGGGTKRGQRADIDRARVLLDEYKARKEAAKSRGRR
jgi:putative addiction module killer protein